MRPQQRRRLSAPRVEYSGHFAYSFRLFKASPVRFAVVTTPKISVWARVALRDVPTSRQPIAIRRRGDPDIVTEVAALPSAGQGVARQRRRDGRFIVAFVIGWRGLIGLIVAVIVAVRAAVYVAAFVIGRRGRRGRREWRRRRERREWRGLVIVAVIVAVIAQRRRRRVRREWRGLVIVCLLYTSPSPRDVEESRMPSSA